MLHQISTHDTLHSVCGCMVRGIFVYPVPSNSACTAHDYPRLLVLWGTHGDNYVVRHYVHSSCISHAEFLEQVLL